MAIQQCFDILISHEYTSEASENPMIWLLFSLISRENVVLSMYSEDRLRKGSSAWVILRGALSFLSRSSELRG